MPHHETAKHKYSKKQARLKLAALVIGLLGVVLFSFAALGAIFSGELHILLYIALPACALFIAMRRQLIGGLVLIAFGLYMTGLMLHSIIVYGEMVELVIIIYFIFGFPILVSGILFLLTWKEGRHLTDRSK